MATPIYCDEAGYTGDDLRQEIQPYFSYAGVALDSEEAAEIIKEIKKLVRTQASEFKGKHLYVHSNGLQGIELLVKRLDGRAAFIVHDKAYALGAKFFEYALEPALSANNNFFYRTNFHRFIANLMYLFLKSGDTDAETVLTHFTQMMRRKSREVEGLFANSLRLSNDPRSIITDIMRIVRSPEVQAAVEDELESISDEHGHVKWMLDLCVTSATSLLRHLSAQYGKLIVTLDDSKPLVASAHALNALGSGPLIPLPKEWGDGLPFNFELAEPIRFASSAAEPGLQLADMVASIAALAMRDKSTERAQRILEHVLPLACSGNVIPASEYIDLTTDEARFNAELVSRLAERADAGIPLLATGLLN
jgi:hypothetical protein